MYTILGKGSILSEKKLGSNLDLDSRAGLIVLENATIDLLMTLATTLLSVI